MVMTPSSGQNVELLNLKRKIHDLRMDGWGMNHNLIYLKYDYMNIYLKILKWNKSYIVWNSCIYFIESWQSWHHMTRIRQEKITCLNKKIFCPIVDISTTTIRENITLFFCTNVKYMLHNGTFCNIWHLYKTIYNTVKHYSIKTQCWE